MSDQIKAGIDGMNAAIAAKLTEVRSLKQSVNVMCRQIGLPPQYDDEDDDVSGTSIRADLFYGKGVTVAVREYLERIKRAASSEEIVKALENGGFDFAEQGWTEGHRPRILSIALGKNPTAFRRLPNGMFGLESWYEPRKAKKDKPEDDDKTESAKSNGTAKNGPAKKDKPSKKSEDPELENI